MNYKLNYISWMDHCSHTESHWRSVTEAAELGPITCHTVGYILHEDDDCVVLGQTIHSHDELDDKYAGDMCILKPLIKTRKELKY